MNLSLQLWVLVFGVYAQLTQVDLNSFLKSFNDLRTSQSLPKACYNQKLLEASQSHANYMASIRDLTHQGADGSYPPERVTEAGFNLDFVAENIAFGQTNVKEVFKSWLGSPDHHASMIESKSVMIGLSTALASESGFSINYWTLVMARGSGESCI
ncbi:hypothetical protein BC833DRAFT_620265 [Globomyces pollinis-pini]|nr:hypothetical protein BC833DRAFT_620265 [Globomyces pollinis-pini]